MRQARLLYREALTTAEVVKATDSNQEISIKGPGSTKLTVFPGIGKRALGLGAHERLLIADEPASWDERSGSLLADALMTSLGKVEGLTLIFIGSLSPAAPGSWWPRLIEGGSVGRTRVHLLQAPPDAKWDDLRLAYSCNPLARKNPAMRAAIRSDRDAARRDAELRPRYEAFRLNRLVSVGSSVLVNVADWRTVLERPCPPRHGPAVLAVDLGATRSWSAAVLAWKNGRVEAFASIPGIPDVAEQEARAQMPRGSLQRQVDRGVVAVAHGRKMAEVDTLMAIIPDIEIAGAVADRFAGGSLEDALDARGVVVEWRKNQWSDASFDIAAFRRAVLDGPLSVADGSAGILSFSVSQAETARDTSGSVKMHKASQYRRDDVAQAAVLAAGALARWDISPEPAKVYAL